MSEELEIMKNYEKEVIDYFNSINENNKKCLNEVAIIRGKKFADSLLEYMEYSEIDSIEGFVEKPHGKKQEIEDNYKYQFKIEWVDQYVNGGYTGDTFEGYVYIYIAKNKYIKLHYSM